MAPTSNGMSFLPRCRRGRFIAGTSLPTASNAAARGSAAESLALGSGDHIARAPSDELFVARFAQAMIPSDEMQLDLRMALRVGQAAAPVHRLVGATMDDRHRDAGVAVFTPTCVGTTLHFACRKDADHRFTPTCVGTTGTRGRGLDLLDRFTPTCVGTTSK